MIRLRTILIFGLVVSCALAPACSARRERRNSAPILTFDHGTYAIRMHVDPMGFIHLSDHPPLMGRLEIGPILKDEIAAPESVLVMLNQGTLYLAGDGFANLWEVRQGPEPETALYRGIPIPGGTVSGVRLSRYGVSGRACVRIDADGTGPWFLTSEGVLDESCS